MKKSMGRLAAGVVGTMLMCFAALPAVCAQETAGFDNVPTIVLEDFSAYEAGETPKGPWVCDSIPRGRAVVERTEDRSGLQLESSGARPQGAYYGLDSALRTAFGKSDFVAEAVVCPEETGRYFVSVLADGGNRCASGVLFDRDGKIKFLANGAWKEAQPYEPEEEYKISVAVYPASKSLAIYIEGAAVSGEIAFSEQRFSGTQTLYFAAESGSFTVKSLRLASNDGALTEYKTDKTLFSDVGKNHWARSYIEKLAEQGIVSGMGDGTFAPKKEITTAELGKMLIKVFGYEESSGAAWDVASYAALAAKGFVRPEDNLAADSILLRKDAAKILARVIEAEAGGGGGPVISGKFTDLQGLSGEELAAVEILDAYGVMNGVTETEFMPGQAVNREQGARMIYSLMEVCG